MRLVLALVFALLLLPAVQAASFECSKAETIIEQAICEDPVLSHADDVMAMAYAGAMAGLAEEAEIVMRKGQRDWLNFSDLVCSDANLPGEAEAAVERIACLQRLYDARLTVLEQSRMVNGMRFFTVDHYATLPDPDGGRFKLGLKVVSSLRMEGNDSRAAAFNAYMRQITEDYTGQYTDFAGTTMDDTVPHEDNSLLMTLGSVNADRISVDLEIEWYGHGAAHANGSAASFHFLTQAERPLVADDIFTGKSWGNVLAGLVAERASADIRGSEITYDGADMIDIATDPKRWSFTRAGLVVQFQDQEVTPGRPAVSIGWEPLRDHFATGASAITRD